jgi:hypothetical protein
VIHVGTGVSVGVGDALGVGDVLGDGVEVAVGVAVDFGATPCVGSTGDDDDPPKLAQDVSEIAAIAVTTAAPSRSFTVFSPFGNRAYARIFRK